MIQYRKEMRAAEKSALKSKQKRKKKKRKTAMNQHQMPPKAPQRKPQGTPSQKVYRFMPQQTKSSPYAAGAKIALVITAVLLVCSIIVLCVALAVGSGTPEPDKPKNTNVTNDTQDSGTVIREPGVKTTPSRSSYTISDASDFQTITGISSRYAVLIDLDHYRAVAGLNADAQICPASMTKIMTVLVACENLKDTYDLVEITQEDVKYQSDHGGSGYNLVAGEKYTVKDLLYLIYFESDTAACLAMSRYIAGSETSFVTLMNNKVKEMGLTQTKFTNSTGLDIDGENYYTTCREMGAILAYALENSLANKILTNTGSYYLQGGNATHKGQPISPGWRVDSGRLGSTTPKDTKVTIQAGKTGWEDVSGSCLITLARTASGKQYIQVIVGGSQSIKNPTGTADVKTIYNTYAK